MLLQILLVALTVHLQPPLHLIHGLAILMLGSIIALDDESIHLVVKAK